MRITINPRLDLETLTWTGNDGTYEYDGPVVLCGGPSQASQENAAAQTAFYNQMTAEQEQVFGEQQGILNAIKSVTMPILQAGPNAYGFTPEEDALLRGEITNQATQAEANAVNATQLRERQLGGGARVLPSGADLQLEEQAHVLGEQGKAEALSREKLAGYEAGRERYSQALAALTGNASLLAPTSYASATSGAGQSATGAINLMDSERSNLLSSILGGVVGAGTSFLTGGPSNIAAGGGFLSGAGI